VSDVSRETPTRRKRYRGPGYDWRDHPDSGECPPCDRCTHRARWAIARPEDWPNDERHHIDVFDWRIRAFACGQHMHAVLDELDWGLDVVQVYDLALIPEGGC
jgi:hypothetical protein